MEHNTVTIELHTRATQMRAWEKHSGRLSRSQFPFTIRILLKE